jgi:hypothetical protein
MLAQLTATGNTGDDSNTSTGTTTAQEMIDAWNAYVNAKGGKNEDTAKAAAIKAAAGYTKSGATPATEADGAFDKVQDLVEADANDWTSAPVLNTLAGLKDAKALTPLSTDAAAVLDESSNPKASEYAERLAAVQNADYTLYDKAVALVDAYDAWNTANTASGDKLTESAINALWDTYVSAYNAISSTDKTDIETLDNSTNTKLGTAGTTDFATAYAAYLDNTTIDGNITSVTLNANKAQDGYTLTGDKTNGYEIHLTSTDATTFTGSLDLEDWLDVTGVKVVWTKDAGDASGKTYSIVDSGNDGATAGSATASDPVTVKFVDYADSKVVAVATVFGKAVTNNAVTVANSEYTITKAAVSAAESGTVNGIALTEADAESGTSVTLLVNVPTTVYVNITAQDGTTKDTVAITVTVQTSQA